MAEFRDIICAAIRHVMNYAEGNSDPSIEANDICNEVYIQIFRDDSKALRRLNKPTSINAWLLTLARNTTRTHLRKRRVRSRTDIAAVREAPAFSYPAQESVVIRGERRDLIEKALSRLDKHERLVVQLFYLHNLKYAEIAESLNMNINTVATKLARARKKLRDELGEFIA